MTSRLSIICDGRQLLEAYGLHGQVTHNAEYTHLEFGHAVRFAVHTRVNDSARYEAMRVAQCNYVQSHFEAAKAHLGNVLLAAASEASERV